MRGMHGTGISVLLAHPHKSCTNHISHRTSLESSAYSVIPIVSVETHTDDILKICVLEISESPSETETSNDVSGLNKFQVMIERSAKQGAGIVKKSYIHCPERLLVSLLTFACKSTTDYKVYLNPSRPSMILPPALARLFAKWNLRFRSRETRTIKPAAIMQAVMPGT
jgi:hypothetical protein